MALAFSFLACGGSGTQNVAHAPMPRVAIDSAPKPCAPSLPTAKTPRGKMAQLFGAAGSEVLRSPAEVGAFRLKPEGEKSAPNAERLAGYLVDPAKRIVTADVSGRWANLLLADENFDLESEAGCAAMPDRGLRFAKGEQSVEIAFDMKSERVFVTVAENPGRGAGFSARFGPSRAAWSDLAKQTFKD